MPRPCWEGGLDEGSQGEAPIRVLTIDLETAPALVYTFQLRDVTIGINQIVHPGGVICFAAKWHGDKKVIYRSTFHDGRDAMVAKAHELLDAADVVVHFNGQKFDVPHMNRLFLEEGLAPPSPYKQVDLWRVGKKFAFLSGRLDHLLQQLGIGEKLKHEGFGLWRGCMNDDPKSWRKMKAYNIADTVQTEALYDRLLPWIPSHPSPRLYDDPVASEGCSRCGSKNLHRRGYETTAAAKYPRFQCRDCGGWMRGTKMESKTSLRGI